MCLADCRYCGDGVRTALVGLIVEVLFRLEVGQELFYILKHFI